MAYIGIGLGLWLEIGLVVGLELASGLEIGRVVRIRQAIYWHGVKGSSPPDKLHTSIKSESANIE